MRKAATTLADRLLPCLALWVCLNCNVGHWRGVQDFPGGQEDMCARGEANLKDYVTSRNVTEGWVQGKPAT